jgi:hypothetical protein
MEKLNLPYFEFKIKKENKNKIILDEIRKIWVKLTPEEWVRQNFIKYLIYKDIPVSLINCEKTFYINKVLKRYDIVVFNNKGDVEILVECKASNIKISNKDFDQLMRYNIELKSKFLILTNGLDHFYFKFNNKEMRYIQVKSFK